jgi:hypothetical protein
MGAGCFATRGFFRWTNRRFRVLYGIMVEILSSESDATATVFITALKALPEAARNQFYAELARDPALMEDLVDIALIEARRDEPARPLTEVLKDLGD